MVKSVMALYRYDTFYLHHHDSYSHDHWNDPTYMNKTVPTQVVKGVTGSDTAYISNVWNISAGRINMYVIHEDGYVYAWVQTQRVRQVTIQILKTVIIYAS